MNETITYQWSESLAKKSLKAYYKSKMGTPWLMSILAALLLCTSILIHSLEEMFSIVFFLLAIFCLARQLRIIYDIKTQSRDIGKLITNPTVEIILTEDSFEKKSESSNHVVTWDKFSKVSHINDFIQLWAGKVLIASFPKESVTDEQLRYISSKIPN